MATPIDKNRNRVGGILFNCFGYSCKRFIRILKWSMPGLIIGTTLLLTLDVFVDLPDRYYSFLNTGIQLIVFSPIAIAVSRDLLLQENFKIHYLQIFMRRFYFRYVLYFALTAFIVSVPYTVFVLAYGSRGGGWGFMHTIVFIPVYYLIFRFWIVLPLKATNANGGLLTAWKIATNHGFSVFLGCMVIIVMMRLLGLLIEFLPILLYSVFQPTLSGWILSQVLETLYIVFCMMIFGSYYSFILTALRGPRA